MRRWHRQITTHSVIEAVRGISRELAALPALPCSGDRRQNRTSPSRRGLRMRGDATLLTLNSGGTHQGHRPAADALTRSTKPPLNSGGTFPRALGNRPFGVRSTKPPLNSGGTTSRGSSASSWRPPLNEAPAKQRRNLGDRKRPIEESRPLNEAPAKQRRNRRREA